jgi:hypothetical protein
LGVVGLQGEVKMLWVIRGTDARANEDISIVVEADTQAEAEYMGRRRGIPVVIVNPANDTDIRIARSEKRLFLTCAETRYKAFGRKIGKFQLAAIMVCGVLTMLLILRVGHVVSPLGF